MSYETKLDRLDVAIRAILTLYRSRKWAILEELGFARGQAAGFEAALAVSDLPLHKWRDEQVFAAVEAFPALVEAAVLLQSRYQARARQSA